MSARAGWGSVCAHVGSIRGMRQKCSDYESLPLCPRHHDHGQPESHHTLQKKFFEHHGLDKEQLIRDFQEAWEARNAA